MFRSGRTFFRYHEKKVANALCSALKPGQKSMKAMRKVSTSLWGKRRDAIEEV
jgi:hypothetical protein